MSLRSFLLRRVMGRLRIDDDTVRHLSTFQRLGETLEVQLPTEMVPVGARTVFRALRTRAAPQIAPDFVWPWWLERQIDPTSPAFVPRGHLPFLTNVTARNWTAIGNVSSKWAAIVDPRGLVTPWADGWSLDWWIGAEDRWHFPSREPGVEQSLVDRAPVVETRMRVPGGFAAHRAYATVSAGEEWAVVEIENRSSVPFAVAFAVRPANPEGLAVVESIGLHDATVTVDGRPALLLPRRPQRMAASTFKGGDSAAVVTSGAAGEAFPDKLRCDAGLAQAAFLFPLAHKATIRVAMPLVPARRRTRRRGVARRLAASTPALPALPASDDVARGWGAQTRRGMRLELPAGRLADAVEANRAYMLLFHDGDEVTPGPATYHRFWFRDAYYLLGALGRYGFHDEVAQVLASYPDRQRVDGFFFSQRLEWDGNGLALAALADHWRRTRTLPDVDDMALTIGRGVRWIERKRHATRRHPDPAVRGLLPAGISAEHFGPNDVYWWDDLWGWKGQADGAVLLQALGQPGPAAEARLAAEHFGADLRRSMAEVAARRGDQILVAGPGRDVDPAIIGCLAAGHPTGFLAPDDPALMATADAVRERFLVGDAFFQAISHTGLGTYLTLQLAFTELAAGDERALLRLAWMLEAATPTFTWPEAIHPGLGGGCMGDGHHGWAAADFLSFVRDMLVREVPESPAPALALCSLFPPEWLGHDVEVHDAPTAFGRLSFGIRWHGERPALLWELERHADLADTPVLLTVPGLDAGFSSVEPAGEALLAPPTHAEVRTGFPSRRAEG